MNDALSELTSIIERLIAPDGCPWDKEQTPETLSEYILEEGRELVSAIRFGSDDEVCEEIGDVLFLLVTIAKHYQNKGSFSFDEAMRRNAAKMVRRHPHVFGNEKFENLDAQLKAWEAIKKEEHKEEGRPEGLYDSLPRDLDPLARAYRIHSKAARVGFTWEDEEAVEQQVEAEWLEFLDAKERGSDKDIKHEIGDLLLSITELGRRHSVKANEALDYANERFLSRFRSMEAAAREKGVDIASMSIDEQNDLWDAAKEVEQAAEGNAAPSEEAAAAPAPAATEGKAD